MADAPYEVKAKTLEAVFAFAKGGPSDIASFNVTKPNGDIEFGTAAGTISIANAAGGLYSFFVKHKGPFSGTLTITVRDIGDPNLERTCTLSGGTDVNPPDTDPFYFYIGTAMVHAGKVQGGSMVLKRKKVGPNHCPHPVEDTARIGLRDYPDADGIEYRVYHDVAASLPPWAEISFVPANAEQPTSLIGPNDEPGVFVADGTVLSTVQMPTIYMEAGDSAQFFARWYDQKHPNDYSGNGELAILDQFRVIGLSNAQIDRTGVFTGMKPGIGYVKAGRYYLKIVVSDTTQRLVWKEDNHEDNRAPTVISRAGVSATGNKAILRITLDEGWSYERTIDWSDFLGIMQGTFSDKDSAQIVISSGVLQNNIIGQYPATAEESDPIPNRKTGSTEVTVWNRGLDEDDVSDGTVREQVRWESAIIEPNGTELNVLGVYTDIKHGGSEEFDKPCVITRLHATWNATERVWMFDSTPQTLVDNPAVDGAVVATGINAILDAITLDKYTLQRRPRVEESLTDTGYDIRVKP